MKSYQQDLIFEYCDTYLLPFIAETNKLVADKRLSLGLLKIAIPWEPINSEGFNALVSKLASMATNTDHAKHISLGWVDIRKILRADFYTISNPMHIRRLMAHTNDPRLGLSGVSEPEVASVIKGWVAEYVSKQEEQYPLPDTTLSYKMVNSAQKGNLVNLWQEFDKKISVARRYVDAIDVVTGDTLLHYALEGVYSLVGVCGPNYFGLQQAIGCVHLLLCLGADPEAKNYFGKTPLQNFVSLLSDTDGQVKAQGISSKLAWERIEASFRAVKYQMPASILDKLNFSKTYVPELYPIETNENEMQVYKR